MLGVQIHVSCPLQSVHCPVGIIKVKWMIWFLKESERVPRPNSIPHQQRGLWMPAVCLRIQLNSGHLHLDIDVTGKGLSPTKLPSLQMLLQSCISDPLVINKRFPPRPLGSIKLLEWLMKLRKTHLPLDF